jgi:hypothetical protein
MKTWIPLTCLLATSLWAQPPPDRPGPGPERSMSKSHRFESDGPGRPGGPEAVERWLNAQKEKNPEEFERLRILRAEDPEAFRAHMRERVEHLRKRAEEGRVGPPPPRLREEVQAVRNAATPEEREAALAALRAKVSEQIDQRLDMREKRIEQIRAELKRLEEQHEADKTDRAALVQRHLDKILADSPPAE